MSYISLKQANKQINKQINIPGVCPIQVRITDLNIPTDC